MALASPDTNGSLGADSLRQHMGHPTSAPQALERTDATLAATADRYLSANGVYTNDKHKLCTDRCAGGVAQGQPMELMTPVSMALTSFGINKFISGASHDLRFTIGQHGVTGAKSFYTRMLPGEAADSGSVISAATAGGVTLNGPDGALADGTILNEAESYGILDAHLIAKGLSAQIWTCQPNSTDATLLVGE